MQLQRTPAPCATNEDTRPTTASSTRSGQLRPSLVEFKGRVKDWRGAENPNQKKTRQEQLLFQRALNELLNGVIEGPLLTSLK
eukprot:2178134-Pyramimonas_sp.AAC.1